MLLSCSHQIGNPPIFAEVSCARQHQRPAPPRPHTDRRTQLGRIAAGIFALGLFASANVLAAPVHRAAKPITDDQGRTRIIIDFEDTAQDAYPAELIARFNPKTDRVHPQVEALVQTYEKQYGFSRVAMTSWVGASVTGYLDTPQIERLASDPNVRLLTEDRAATFSSPPPWYAAWNGSPWTELNDWGRVAVNGKTVLPGSTRKVYVIDSGVAHHDDLGSVSQRVNVVCETGNTTDCSGEPSPYISNPQVGFYQTVGCYAHATHVAGIIGATANNGQNRSGVYAGVNMVSIAIGASSNPEYPGGPWIKCASSDTQFVVNQLWSTIGNAFDYIRYQNTAWMGFGNPVQIATMSLNGAGIGYSSAGVAETNLPKLQQLVTPQQVSWYIYPGVLFVNSAGNQNQNACGLNVLNNASSSYKTSAYANATAIDGIVVVGAINSNGYSVSPFSTSQPVGLTGGEAGSNFGPCVDIWAPGEMIYSTWGYGPDLTKSNLLYSGGQPSSYVFGSSWLSFLGWAWASGTSMAAPHVAAAAAYVADKYELTTPAQIEAKLREVAQNYGRFDAAGQPIQVVYLPD